MKPTITRTPYNQARFNLARVEAQQRTLKTAGIAIAILGFICLSLLFSGCAGTPTNPNGPMTHAAFTAAVTVGEQIGIETHPEATPYLRGAAQVVCAVASGTNVSPAAIVSALEAANMTNATARIIINGSLALLNVVVAGAGTNQTEIRLYGQDLCTGMTAGLPPETAHERMAARKNGKALPPHLR